MLSVDGRDAVDTSTGDRDVWRELGDIAFQRRTELGLTQEDFAKKIGVSVPTVQRIESGREQTRRSPSWPKLEAGYGWGPGFISNFVSGRVTDAPRAEEGGRFIRTPRPDGDEDIRDIVRQILGQYAPGTTIGEVLKAEDAAVEIARRRGLIGPDTQETADLDESPAKT